MSKDYDTEFAIKERMARLAEQNGCRAEMVTNSSDSQNTNTTTEHNGGT